MASWLQTLPLLLLLLLCLTAARGKEDDPILEFTSDTHINNVVQDRQSGRIYLGAINSIYQLGASLHLESRAKTGPMMDARSCTPPASVCTDTKETDNLNKLLLVHQAKDLLIVCGSVYRGICSLRNLTEVEQLLYYSDRMSERTYVASIEEGVNVVAVMSSYEKDLDVFLVGKGYGSMDSTKLISTRILQDIREWVVFESIIEASSVQATPFKPKYMHDFRHAFKEEGFIYFLFSRTRDGLDNKNLTFVSRLCEDDQHYYSYTELQLNCGPKNQYHKVQAAYVAAPGKELARDMTESGHYGTVHHWQKVLFMVASPDDDHTDSALCMYPLNAINERIVDIISACYSDSGKIAGQAVVDIPYSSKTEEFCAYIISNDTLNSYKCGGDFLPSPLASKPVFALEAEAVVIKNGLLTAVAIAVENDHTVAFLGNSQGEVYKAHLTSRPEVYSRGPGDTTGEKVNKNLFFDLGHNHLYITTEKKITKVPVQACHLKTDCQSCVALRDPYCGWCVLEGRCTRRSDCKRAEEKNGWLWSPRQQCVKIVSFHPPNLSCRKTQQINMVEINIPSLPSIGGLDRLRCVFPSFYSEGAMSDSGQVTCSLPNPRDIPPTPENQDFVAVPVKIYVNETVELATREFKFYNCSATVKKAENTPCMACVASLGGCQWNTRDHTCHDMDDTAMGPNIIKHRKGATCPQFENPDPVLVPVGFKTTISFEGINLDLYKDRAFSIGTELMRNMEEDVRTEDGPFYSFSGFNFSFDKSPETNVLFYVKDKDSGKKIDSTLNVTLYNCSMGREDCSLCKNADPKYRCVWCARRKSCVYEKLCAEDPQNTECPPPQISDIIPRYGPMMGGISVTIRGSNLGIRKEDIKRITVAGVPCVHQWEKYTVSTSVVCEIGPVDPLSASWGQVEVEVEGGKIGASSVYFTYRDPEPQEVRPSRGPRAGGTLITISGRFLDTAAKDDVHVTVGDVRCTVEHFGAEIICSAGEYRARKLPSGPQTMTIKYGRRTTKTVPSAFRFLENPTVLDHHPKSSFVCGGRTIMVTGSGFDIIQSAVMKFQVLGNDWTDVPHATTEFLQSYRSNTVIHFKSPALNETYEGQEYRTVIQLDNWARELKPFDYHPDPTFNSLSRDIITPQSLIEVTGRGLDKAMTRAEAEVFIGGAACTVATMTYSALYAECPSTPDPMDLLIKFGNGEWIVGSVRNYEKKYEMPFLIIIPGVFVPMLLIIAILVYWCRRKSQQLKREYKKVKHQLENLEESIIDSLDEDPAAQSKQLQQIAAALER